MKVLGLDVETTGLNHETDYITEIGCVLYDVEKKAPMVIGNWLLEVPETVEITPLITKLTGIDRPMLNTYGVDPVLVLTELKAMIAMADCYMAHNAQFDKGFIEDFTGEESTIPWICSKANLPHEEVLGRKVSSKSLEALSGYYSVVNAFAHRALFDVLTMLKIAEQHDLYEALKYAQEESLTFFAMVSYEDKDKAKEMGFSWCGKRRRWYMEIPQSLGDQLIRRGEAKGVNIVLGS